MTSSRPVQERLFRAVPHPSCLRGLSFIYECERPIDAERLVRELNARYDNRIIISHEAWGPRAIRVAIFQFRFELRIPADGKIVEWMHRETASRPDREADRAMFEHVLGRMLQPA